ncbi:NAD(P)/FAD-dependent oxidoreductase [uncultured Slackia sp.]|uniref:NAD(P)/FAD-dependent oxidoreductase n=1 Tax=uncultured Slackia sp. TaxID=665903 RepID=UPI0026DB08A7|nr:NAD(P)/FAD-dependent oxidoreductase [uncultured Slackia sp.]
MGEKGYAAESVAAKQGARHAGSGFSRRSFFKGAAAFGAVAAGAGALSGCAPTKSTKAEWADAGVQHTLTPGDAAREVNPQDDGYTAYTTDYSALFQPLTIAGHTAPNRIAKSAAGSETLFGSNAEPALAPTTYYENMAKGGVGMIWVESGDPTPDHSGMEKAIGRDEDVEYWKPFVEKLHQHGCFVGMQITGNYTNFSSSKMHYSDWDMNNAKNTPMTNEQVKTYIQNWINGAVNLQKMGFDGVELNASCSHTLDSFLSRFWNVDRTDEYDGSCLENRARIVTEMISGIREKCGEDFVIQVLYSPIEENLRDLGDNSLCMKLAEGVELAKLFEKAGASSLQCRSTLFGSHAAGFMVDLMHVPVHGHTEFGTVANFSQHMDGAWNGAWDGAASLLNVAAEVKKNVSIPVGVVGCMDPRLAPDVINDAIANGDIDFICMTRPLLADPELPNKLKEGRRDEVAPCAHCLTCFTGGKDMTSPVLCRVNATITRAFSEDMPEGTDLVAAPEKKNVMVVGAGPAGMEAARVAALRGHNVTLYEKSGLGGMLDFAMNIKGPHEKIADMLAYLKRQLDLAGVNVVTGKEVDAAFVEQQNPDAVIVATGGKREALDVPGADGSNVCSIENYAAMDLGETVAVVGGGLQAVDFAIYLVRDQGKKVVMVYDGPDADVDHGHPIYIKASNLAWLRAQGVQILTQSHVVEISDGCIVVDADYGIEKEIAVDSVVSCPDMQPSHDLADAIGDSRQVIVVGDAAEHGTISAKDGTICHAIATGNIAGRQVSPADAQYDPMAKMSGEQLPMPF